MQERKESLRKALPATVDVFGHAVRVEVTTLRGCFGDFNIDDLLIRIDCNQSTERAHWTLFHEIMHAALALGGVGNLLDERTEEAVVRCLEHALPKHITKLASQQ